MSFNISVNKDINIDLDYAVVSLNGKIDIGYYNFLLKKLKDVLLSGRQNIFVDCTGVTFISSMGISAIVEAKNYTVNNGGRFIIIGLNDKIRQVFDLIGILSLMDVCETLDEAISLIHPEPSLL